MFGGVILVLLLGAAVGFAFWRSSRGSKVLTDPLSEPLNGATTAKVDINAGAGNLAIDRLTGGEPLLVSGALQYPESQGVPMRTLNSSSSQAAFSLKSEDAGKPWIRFPWDACNLAFDWQIHLNPAVSADITAHSGGGNVRLDLAGMLVTNVSADTGGGNIAVVLPDNTADLNVTAKTGAGNVTVEIGSGLTGSSTVIAKSGAGNVVIHLPNGIAARLHVNSGMGKIKLDPRFIMIDKNTYQSSDYENAANKVEITAGSGAGDVSVSPK
jgi:hypothetical protein